MQPKIWPIPGRSNPAIVFSLSKLKHAMLDLTGRCPVCVWAIRAPNQIAINTLTFGPLLPCCCLLSKEIKKVIFKFQFYLKICQSLQGLRMSMSGLLTLSGAKSLDYRSQAFWPNVALSSWQVIQSFGYPMHSAATSPIGEDCNSRQCQLAIWKLDKKSSLSIKFY